MFRSSTVGRVGVFSTFLANSIITVATAAHITAPFAVLAFSGAAFRLALSLPWSIYGDQCTSRIACALPELQEAHFQYLDVVTHPRSHVWERRVATQHLENERRRIFAQYRTDNTRLFIPHLVAGGVALYSAVVPGQQIGRFLLGDGGAATLASPWAMVWMPPHGVVEWATTTPAVGAVLLDPTLPLVAALSYYNMSRALQARRGFTRRMDQRVRNAHHLLLGVCALVLCCTPYLSAVVAAGSPASGVPALWLGMSVVSFGKTLLVQTAPGRALLRVEAYPPTHGSYGDTDTGEAHPYRLAYQGEDVEERRYVWQSQKRLLDFECNLRLHRMVTRLPLFSPVNELEYEAKNLQRKAEAARARREAAHAATTARVVNPSHECDSDSSVGKEAADMMAKDSREANLQTTATGTVARQWAAENQPGVWTPGGRTLRSDDLDGEAAWPPMATEESQLDRMQAAAQERRRLREEALTKSYRVRSRKWQQQATNAAAEREGEAPTVDGR